MKFVIVDNKIVTNIVISDQAYELTWKPAAEEVGIGWIDNEDGTFTAPPPEPVIPEPRKVILTHYEYMNRFTMDELRAIYTAAKTVVDIEIWLDKFKLAQEVNLDDPNTIDGLDKMETFQLIGVGRSSEIRGL